MDEEDRALDEENEKILQNISEGESTIKYMVKDINDLDKMSAQMKGDLLQVQKHIQNQISKSEGVAETIKKYESTFKFIKTLFYYFQN